MLKGRRTVSKKKTGDRRDPERKRHHRTDQSGRVLPRDAPSHGPWIIPRED